MSLLFVGGLCCWRAALHCLARLCAIAVALCYMYEKQATSFWIQTAAPGTCSSISLWRVWIARGISLLLEWVISKLVLCVWVAICCRRSNWCRANVAESHYFFISSSNLKDFFIWRQRIHSVLQTSHLVVSVVVIGVQNSHFCRLLGRTIIACCLHSSGRLTFRVNNFGDLFGFIVIVHGLWRTWLIGCVQLNFDHLVLLWERIISSQPLCYRLQWAVVHWGVTPIVTAYSTAFELFALAQRTLASRNTFLIVSHVAVIVINKIGFLMVILRGRLDR